MIPVKTSVDDIKRLLGYLARQVGWVEASKVEKALGSIDDRKISAMVEFGLIIRDGGNVKMTPRGQLFSSDEQARALRETLDSIELYRATLEWAHYGKRAEVTATEVGQYWEGSHSDTLGSLRGSTLKDGAVCFGRVVEGAKLGSFTVGRGGKETRIEFNLPELEQMVAGSATGAPPVEDAPVEGGVTAVASATPTESMQERTSPVPTPSVAVSASPSIHVNVEIHIAADAKADTVREIFRNMARYVLDKPISDDAV